jgi:energy-converting hydrogenase A subunit R
VTERIYITDCEGPVSKNDNAYELAEAFLEDGGRLFGLLSKFDDYLGDVERIKGYKYGSTLRYILPFLKAAGVTDEGVREFSGRHMTVMTGIRETLRVIMKAMEVYMVSTSYPHYIAEVAQYIGLNRDNMYCTQVSFDAYTMEDGERALITESGNRFLTLPAIEWDDDKAVSRPSMDTVRVLKEFFFRDLSSYPVHGWMENVDPIGGEGKADAIMNIVNRNGGALDRVMYVGDSITDVNALALVRERGGASVSFNGNSYAVLDAEYIVVSRDARVLEDMALCFAREGKEGIKTGIFANGTHVYRKDECDLKRVILLSETVRKEVRGQAVGSLG